MIISLLLACLFFLYTVECVYPVYYLLWRNLIGFSIKYASFNVVLKLLLPIVVLYFCIFVGLSHPNTVPFESDRVVNLWWLGQTVRRTKDKFWTGDKVFTRTSFLSQKLSWTILVKRSQECFWTKEKKAYSSFKGWIETNKWWEINHC